VPCDGRTPALRYPQNPLRREAVVPAYIETRTRVIALVAFGATLATLLLRFASANSIVVFVAAAAGLAGLAALVGEGTEQLGHRLGPRTTGILQSALGNLPELFIGLFALRAGMLEVVRAALVGSILANTLLVLGLAFLFGGLRNGVQRFGADQTRMMSTLLILAVAALAVPTIATAPGNADFGHEEELSIFTSIILLVVFVASTVYSIGSGPSTPAVGTAAESRDQSKEWPLRLAVGSLLVSSVAAVFVSDWFVEALRPAMGSLGMSETFAGFVVVAIAGNAVENVAGVQAMLRNKGDLAISIILNSSLQVALALAPVLVIASLFIGGAALSLVVSPLLVAALALATMLAALVVIDGESTWLEGVALIGLYLILAASLWWGTPIS
jgi:Ca2+:H+ antiporter